MNEKLQEIIEKKIEETLARTDEIKKIIKSMDDLSTKTSDFAFGIIIGRLYNSFYYQCRRILNRNPTEQEFSEFLEILKKRQFDLIKKFS